MLQTIAPFLFVLACRHDGHCNEKSIQEFPMPSWEICFEASSNSQLSKAHASEKPGYNITVFCAGKALDEAAN